MAALHILMGYWHHKSEIHHYRKTEEIGIICNIAKQSLPSYLSEQTITHFKTTA